MNENIQHIGDINNSIVRNVNSATINDEKIKSDKRNCDDNISNNSKWHIKYWYIIISVLSLVTNILLVCFAFPRVIREDNIGFDYLGIIVGVLSLLITILIGWNIYTMVDFNRKTKEMERKVEREIRNIKTEYQNIEDDYREIEKSLKHTQSDITFISILNNTVILDRESNDNFVQYIFDGYMDALDVAIRDNLTNDRVEDALTRLINLTQRCRNLIKSKFPILPKHYDYYYQILAKDRLSGEKAEKIKELFKNGIIEADTNFPPIYVRVMSRYNPDFQSYEKQKDCKIAGSAKSQ